jgi:hypothetical protein
LDKPTSLTKNGTSSALAKRERCGKSKLCVYAYCFLAVGKKTALCGAASHEEAPKRIRVLHVTRRRCMRLSQFFDRRLLLTPVQPIAPGPKKIVFKKNSTQESRNDVLMIPALACVLSGLTN